MAEQLKLTPMMEAFVEAFVSQGGRNATKAAVAAGYSAKTAYSAAHALINKPHVLDAIMKRVERDLKAHVVVAAKTLYTLATNAKSESVRLQAAQALLDRGGMQLVARSEHRHVLEDRRSDEELKIHVENLTRQLGLQPRLIEHAPLPVCDQLPVIDADTLEPEPISAPDAADKGSDAQPQDGDAVPGDEVDPFA